MPNDATNPQANSQFEPLTFDASAAPGAARCSRCGTQLRGSYHMIGESMACAKCRYAAQSGQEQAGGPVGRAIMFGLGAAAAGGIIDYAYAKLTGSTWPLFVILAAYAAGRAVRAGSGGHGGRKFQVTAMAMAYLAICFAFAPLYLLSTNEARATVVAAEQARVDSIVAANPDGAELDSASAAAVSAAKRKVSIAKALTPTSAGGARLFVVFVFGAPLIVALENPIFGLFLAFSLYRSWRLNEGNGTSPTLVTVSGPFRLGTPPVA